MSASVLLFLSTCIGYILAVRLSMMVVDYSTTSLLEEITVSRLVDWIANDYAIL